MALNAGYKAQKYRETYKINHYGWDLGSVSGSRPLRGMGKGAVMRNHFFACSLIFYSPFLFQAQLGQDICN